MSAIRNPFIKAIRGNVYSISPEAKSLEESAVPAPSGEYNATQGKAYFVKFPSRIEILSRAHSLDAEKRYTVVMDVALTKIDYENFITDLTVERAFLESAARLCSVQPDGALPCVLARQIGRNDGVLAVPDELGFVILAAYLCDVRNVMPKDTAI